VRVRAQIASTFVCAALLFGTVACGQDSSGSGQASPSDAFDPATAFAQRCAMCHGADGQGAVGPQLNHGAGVRKYPNIEDEIAVVTHGRGGMPSFASQGMTAAQIRAVVEYTRDHL
jgi:mono/diheme cytochrome c family protein